MSLTPDEQDLFKRLLKYDWPSQTAYHDFYRAAELLWGTEQGRKEVESWLPIIGVNDMWSIEQLREHLSPSPAIPPLPNRPRGRPRKDGRLPGEPPALQPYRDALKQRSEALKQSRLLVEAEKLRHLNLQADWDRYVQTVKESCESAQQSPSGS